MGPVAVSAAAFAERFRLALSIEVEEGALSPDLARSRAAQRTKVSASGLRFAQAERLRSRVFAEFV